MPKLKYDIEKSKEQKTMKDLEEQQVSTFQGAKVLNYKDDQIKRLNTEIFEEFKAIKDERDAIGYDSFCDGADNQYKGIMPRRAGAQFNLDTGLTKIKENDIVRSIMAAIWGVDPIVSIKPRPEFASGIGPDVAQKQEEFLDYGFDMKLPFRSPFRKASHSAVRKKVGWIKWIHKIKTEPKVRTETYKPELEQRPDPNQEGAMIMVNKGVENFMRAHGEAYEKEPEKHQWIIDRLNDNKPVTLDVDIEEPVYNDPFPVFVDNKNFFVRLNTEGYQGVCEARLTVERVNLTYYELKKLEKEYGFINVDKLLYKDEDDEKNNKVRPGAYNEKFDILECVYRFKENNQADEDEERIVCFFAEEKKLYLGGIYYPWTVLEGYYVPHYVIDNEVGIYKGCVSEDIRDNHIADNAILNFTLEGAWIANMVTPITPEDSAIDIQFANKRWAHGIPLNARKDEIDFLQNYMKPPDVAGLMLLKAEITRNAGDLSMVSDLRTGRESPLDPRAPGNKTMALLQESGKGVRDYVEEIQKGFAIDVTCALKIYYEISQKDIPYFNKRAMQVVGEDPFKKITKGELIAKTTIQPMAHAFDFDRLNAKKEDVVLYQLYREEPLVARNPQAVWTLLRNIGKNWSAKWRQSIDQILPSLEALKAQQAQMASKAVMQFVQQALEKAKLTKQEPEFDPMALMQVVSDLQALLVTPPPEEGKK